MARQQSTGLRRWFIQNLSSNLFFQIIITLLLMSLLFFVSLYAGALPNPLSKRADSCAVTSSELSLDKKVVQVNGHVDVSVQVGNPQADIVLYNWRAIHGTMSPSNQSNTSRSRYTAPSTPVDDTIAVDVTSPGCSTITKVQQIAVIVPPPVPDTTAEANRFAVPPIFDRPGGDISFVQFDYDPTYERGSLRLYVCVTSQYYRIKSEEIAPRPRVLVDRAYPATEPCAFKYPVIELQVGDVENIGIGTGDLPNETFANMRFYRIRRTEQGLELLDPLTPTPTE